MRSPDAPTPAAGESPDAAEARRVLLLCNACQFCDGYCPVFPALKRRRTLAEADLTFLANLCHNCRACYHACQYAPPHGFAVNLPRSLSLVRQDSYARHVRPAPLGRLFRRNGQVVLGFTAALVAALLLAALALIPAELLFARHAGPGAFYRLVPWPLMAGVAGLAAGWAVLAVGCSVASLWRAMGPAPRAALAPSLWEAVRDAVSLRHLGGGGAGCNDRTERFSTVRRRFHHAMAGGMVLCFAATSVATIYDHLFGWPAPYPLLSLPVLLGTAGGIGVMAGTAGLAALKWRADPGPVAQEVQGTDLALLVQLFLAAASGLVLLALRDGPAMGVLLLAHLGIVLALFLTVPCGKLLHAPFRLAALLRDALERRVSGRGRAATGSPARSGAPPPPAP
ncbi:tricarballylate utilization 4Fe-4S protein TcuB [Azospirillum thermophilum]|uniref:Tricarballylate utilization 4Fe-4S protein TcuB n=1 Tax=Azospirillum thermophilum TaxID=2202148 RepID=A0A2S2CQD8_9PROT|nr:tricarballylate utilization 4Fe-4S protein TcuB [Azospirillum thermophilum]AWK86696.1 tricarballylate utilization 4Fe-4S protein TcuB [Azospirillum thermophilum]